MTEEMKGRTVGGEGKTAEIDGGYFMRSAHRRAASGAPEPGMPFGQIVP